MTHRDRQEPEMERQLLELFKEVRTAGQKNQQTVVSSSWQAYFMDFYISSSQQTPRKMAEYSGFKFSNGWFQSFRKRVGISARRKSGQSQIYVVHAKNVARSSLCSRDAPILLSVSVSFIEC